MEVRSYFAELLSRLESIATDGDPQFVATRSSAG
jgi:hypothetical protein